MLIMHIYNKTISWPIKIKLSSPPCSLGVMVTPQVLSSCGLGGKSRAFKSQEGNFIDIYI